MRQFYPVRPSMRIDLQQAALHQHVDFIAAASDLGELARRLIERDAVAESGRSDQLPLDESANLWRHVGKRVRHVAIQHGIRRMTIEEGRVDAVDAPGAPFLVQ